MRLTRPIGSLTVLTSRLHLKLELVEPLSIPTFALVVLNLRDLQPAHGLRENCGLLSRLFHRPQLCVVGLPELELSSPEDPILLLRPLRLRASDSFNEGASS